VSIRAFWAEEKWKLRGELNLASGVAALAPARAAVDVRALDKVHDARKPA
jgi:hypothetical protein